MLKMSASELLKRFYVLQEERVKTYQMFDEGFLAYLAGGPNYNFALYKQLVHEITTTFKNISDEVISVQKKLEAEYADVANIISKIQENEKVKLEHTARLQIATQNAQDKPTDMSYEEECESLKHKLEEKRASIYELMEELKYESEDLIDYA